ncbi:U7 snRNA-associated Sm-like protein LSm10 [Saccostrea echinata]|uniref:U7 snRNA-associated Sm-like protein LSm10 n=1 Tax=Saccostrea echinata TaxID=191078 RepID=UPI002A7EDA6D|nr:U7 snRNA-associated Sm-like protein LSm10 [Saccostrea echinata]
MTSEREKYLVRNTLISLLKAVEGKETTVELRNENSVTGKVEDVDGFMNIIMRDVVFRSFRGMSQNFSSFFVQGQNVRYVHIPDEIDMRAAIDHQVNKEWRMKAQFTRDVRKAAKAKITKRELQAKKEDTLRQRQKEFEEKKNIPQKT